MFKVYIPQVRDAIAKRLISFGIGVGICVSAISIIEDYKVNSIVREAEDGVNDLQTRARDLEGLEKYINKIELEKLANICNIPNYINKTNKQLYHLSSYNRTKKFLEEDIIRLEKQLPLLITEIIERKQTKADVQRYSFCAIFPIILGVYILKRKSQNDQSRNQ